MGSSSRSRFRPSSPSRGPFTGARRITLERLCAHEAEPRSAARRHSCAQADRRPDRLRHGLHRRARRGGNQLPPSAASIDARTRRADRARGGAQHSARHRDGAAGGMGNARASAAAAIEQRGRAQRERLSRQEPATTNSKRNSEMGFDQYHEPPEELSQATRTFARMIASLTEEAEAIGWYEQRIALEKDKTARAIMQNAQKEEFKHFGMDLEFLLRRTPQWRAILQDILFKPGDIVEHGEEAEDES